jgi:hypothetical protein
VVYYAILYGHAAQLVDQRTENPLVGVTPWVSRLDAPTKARWFMRVHIKALINANLASWQTGYEKANH